jgi:OPA family glycerol-3-phosphate transporter-like MFS transporter
MASVQVESGGLKGYFAKHRTLESYPQGGYRWWMLALTVMATVVSFYEFGFSALLPYWMKSLHFSEEDFTYFLAAAVFLSAISAMFGGPLADRHGRVVVIDACLVVIVALTFCNLLMTGFWSFVIVRGLMNIVAGLMWGALGGLTRDMSPRVSRGAAFGLLTLGAVACQWLWNFIPAKTLLMFGERWQAEILMMGILAVILTIPVLIGLKDLSPKLRMAVVGEDVGEAFESGDLPGEAPAGARAAFGQLLGRMDSWVIVLGSVAFLTVAITIQTFGPLMFSQAFKFSRPEAAAMTANFWLFNLIMLVPAGYLSDLLRVRKPISIVMAAVMLAMLIWWLRNFDPPLSRNALGWVTLLLGGMAASAFIPWAALYSEYLEDLSPSLQATGWSFFQMAYRLWIVISGLLIPYVTRVYGWEVWMDLMVITVIIFMGSLLMLRGRWRPALSGDASVHGSRAQAAGGR